MVCRHAKDDPSCSATQAKYDYNRAVYDMVPPPKQQEEIVLTPDSSNYSVEEVAQVGNHLVLKVNYPNCKKCSYEGVKVLVYLNVTALQALKWKKIDPHFTDPKSMRKDSEAPGPNARFPASEAGWKDAIVYARSKC